MNAWAAFSTPAPSLESRSLACLGAGEHFGALRSCQNRSLPSHALVILTSGQGTYVDANNARNSIQAPCLIWIFPGVKHGYGPDRNGWTEHWILFSGPTAQIYQDLGFCSRTEPTVGLDAPISELDGLFEKLRTELNSLTLHAHLQASLCAQQIIAAAISATPGSDQRLQSDLIQKLAGTVHLSMSLADRARLLGVTEDSMRRSIRSTTGLTPVEYIAEVRLRRARSLLIETQKDIRTIAGEVGYEDPAYFSRVFHRATGVSPTGFRLQQKKEYVNLRDVDEVRRIDDRHSGAAR